MARTGKNQKAILEKLTTGSKTIKQLVEELNLKHWSVGYQAVKALQGRGKVTYNNGQVTIAATPTTQQ